MKPPIYLIVALLLVTCQRGSKVFEDLNSLAEFEKDYELTLIQTGKESGFLEPLNVYSIFQIDSLEFNHLHNSVLQNTRFKKDKYHLNNELNDYLYQNNLQILNMSNCSISENIYDEEYHIYLLSDNRSFAVLKINH